MSRVRSTRVSLSWRARSFSAAFSFSVLASRVEARGLEFAEQFATALAERRGQCLQGRIEFGRQRNAGGCQRLDHGFGLVCQQRAEGRHGGVRLLHDRRGARVDHGGEGFARGLQTYGDFFRRERELFLQLFMGTDDRRADSFGVIDDGVTFGAQFVDEAAHAQLVVGIAALECGDFGMDQRFQFGRAGNRALDALVHRRDFATDGLADGHDALGCDRFRFRETQRNFRHGAGGVAQVMGTGHHDGEGEEQHDREECPDEDRNDARHGNDVGNRVGLPDGAAIEKLGKANSAKDPEHGNDRGIAQRRLQRGGFQRFQHGRRRAARSRHSQVQVMARAVGAEPAPVQVP